MTAVMCGMCLGCARGFGGLSVSVLIAAVGAALMLLANPFLVFVPMAAAVVPAIIWRQWEGLCLVLGAILAAALVYAAFRRGADLTTAGALSAAAMLAGTVSYGAVLLITQAGSITAGLASMKASFADMLRAAADQISAAYGGSVQIYDSDIDDMISATVAVIPGMALFVYQLAGMLVAALSAAILRLCGAGGAISPDGKWRCADSVSAAAVFVLSLIFFGLSSLFAGGSAAYYAGYNIMLAFLPAALAMGVRALFTRRGMMLKIPFKMTALSLAALSMCLNPLAAFQIIAVAGSIAVLRSAWVSYRDKDVK